MNNQESLPQGSIIVDRLQGGPSVFVQRQSTGGPPITRGDQPCIHRWSYGDHQCIDADGPPDHACVRRWSPRTTFEWDQILHDRATFSPRPLGCNIISCRGGGGGRHTHQKRSEMYCVAFLLAIWSVCSGKLCTAFGSKYVNYVVLFRHVHSSDIFYSDCNIVPEWV